MLCVIRLLLIKPHPENGKFLHLMKRSTLIKSTNGPMYNWFWGKTGPQDAVMLQDSLNPFYNNSTHWYRQNYRTAGVINANLQASGGSENVRYMVGAGYYDEKGIAINTDFNVLTYCQI